MTPNPSNEPGCRRPGNPHLRPGHPDLPVSRVLALLIVALIGASCQVSGASLAPSAGDPGPGSPESLQQGNASAADAAGGIDSVAGNVGGSGRFSSDGASGGDSQVVYSPRFRTGYEPDEAAGTPTDEITSLTFRNLGTGRSPVNYGIQYLGGSVADRHATLVPDPTRPGNHVLRFWMRNAAVPTKYKSHTLGRIQTKLGFPSPVEQLYSKQRVYLHPDIAHFLSYPPDGDKWWLSIVHHELWAGSEWQGHPNSARLSVNLWADFDRGKLFFIAFCDTTSTFENFWTEVNRDYALPIGEWFTLEIAYRMGNDSNGRFVLRAQADSASSPTTVFDVTNWTYSPYADKPGGTGPVGLTHWNPQIMRRGPGVLG